MRPELSAYSHLTAGKVREIYEIDDDTLLMVVSDRISAYDHILDTPIPDKGRVLTAMSVFFFDELDFPNHLAGPADDERIPEFFEEYWRSQNVPEPNAVCSGGVDAPGKQS